MAKPFFSTTRVHPRPYFTTGGRIFTRMSYLGAPDSIRLLDPLFTTDAMREVFSDRQCLQRMLDFEAALARALRLGAGIAPKTAIEADRGPNVAPSCSIVESLARSAARSPAM